MSLDDNGMRPRVAVVIPCYNAAAYIGEAVESALAQTYPAVDIIVVNDGSTDEFERAMAPFRHHVSVITQLNAGQGAARNRGIAATRADFVAFLDSDDRWQPEKTARQMAVLMADPECGLVHTSRRLIDAAGRPLQRSPLTPELREQAQGRCLAELIRGNSIIVSSVIVRRRLLEAEPFATNMGGVEDWDLWLRLAARTRFAWIDQPLTDYRVHDTNFSWARPVMSRATIKLMEGVLQREHDRAIRLAADAHRLEYILEVAHLEFERGNRREARRWFHEVLPRLRAADLVRYGATFMPDRLYPVVREAWRALRRYPA